MGLEDSGQCWLCGRSLERTDPVTHIPNLSFIVHTSCYQVELELTNDDSTDRRFGVD